MRLHLFFLKENKKAIIKLTIAERRNGTEEPNLSHKIPVVKEPNITAKLDIIVNKPIAGTSLFVGN